MFRCLQKRIRTLANNNSGFTLIEVIISIAVISMVSVTLLQMFSVSARVNREAYDMDTAKSICVETSEKYKIDPTSSSKFLASFDATEEVMGERYYERYYRKYYDESWSDAVTPGEAFKLEIKSKRTVYPAMPTSYYPEAAFSDSITGNAEFVIELQGTSNYIIRRGYSEYTIDSSKIIYSSSSVETAKTALIPIHLDCSGIDAKIPHEVKIRNNIGSIIKGGVTYEAIADIYLCDIPPGGVVEVNAVSGISSKNEVFTTQQIINKYEAEVSVIRASDNFVMAENEVERYWVGN